MKQHKYLEKKDFKNVDKDTKSIRIVTLSFSRNKTKLYESKVRYYVDVFNFFEKNHSYKIPKPDFKFELIDYEHEFEMCIIDKKTIYWINYLNIDDVF